MMAQIKFVDINKIFDNGVHAVNNFNLTINSGEFVVFVGPSGCGKTTTLRMLAGLEDITSGEIYIDDVLVNDLEPKDRNIAMVFQNYALYPHMTVYDNMAYGLKFKKVPKEEIQERIFETIKILDFEESLLKRRPCQLSGGQKQRVALGRAIVRRPGVFLMDEPLSNLDAKLRVQMRSEITKIHDEVDATTIYVTHDQIEAMTMASRIVIMHKGLIQQIGIPEDVYNYPENTFVAGFLGSPAMNCFEVFYDGNYLLFDENNKIKVPDKYLKIYKNYIGKQVIFGIRPEDCYIDDKEMKDLYPDSTIKTDVYNVELLGYEQAIYGHIGEAKIISKIDVKHRVNKGDKVFTIFDMSKFHLFDYDTKIRIREVNESGK